MLVDTAEISIRSGKGGDGCVSFLREKYNAHGGPDGGDGGQGGSVYLCAVEGIDTLLDYSGRHHWRAENGKPGMGKEQSGKSGDDLEIKLPAGTLVYDVETDILLVDLSEPGQRVCVAQGGKGGRGNRRFASATHRTPREFEHGIPPQERRLRLELKLIADVGIVGLPNAGKSTFLSRVTHAHPKVAAYPFTTLEPNLGIAELSGQRRIVLADIPGLIEGAHEGSGLGDEFLKHIERTRVLMHMIDINPIDAGTTPEQAYRIIRAELEGYSAELANKPEIVIASKMDLLSDNDDALKQFSDAVGCDVLQLSSVSGSGLDDILEKLWDICGKKTKSQQQQDDPVDLPIPPHLRFPS